MGHRKPLGMIPKRNTNKKEGRLAKRKITEKRNENEGRRSKKNGEKKFK